MECKAETGKTLSSLRRSAESHEHYERALEMYEQLPGTDRDQAGCFENAGLMLMNLGRYPEALEHFDRALNMYKKLPGAEMSTLIYVDEWCSGVNFGIMNNLIEKAMAATPPKLYMPAALVDSSIPSENGNTKLCKEHDQHAAKFNLNGADLRFPIPARTVSP